MQIVLRTFLTTKFGNLKLHKICEILNIDYQEMAGIIYKNKLLYDKKGRFKSSIIKLSNALKIDPVILLTSVQKIRWQHLLLKQLKNEEDYFEEETSMLLLKDNLSEKLLEKGYFYE